MKVSKHHSISKESRDLEAKKCIPPSEWLFRSHTANATTQRKQQRSTTEVQIIKSSLKETEKKYPERELTD